MKRFACFAAVAGMAALLVSCNNVSSMLGGAKYPADQTESYAKAVEILKEKIDTTKFKIFAMRFQEGEELSNDLSSISLDMVNADNYAFRQAYYLDGRVGQMNDYSTSVNEIDYAKIKGISLSAIDPAAIGRQIEEAKQLLPEGHTFQSVSVYEISEVLPRSTGLMNRGRDIGAQEGRFQDLLHRGRQGDRDLRRPGDAPLLRSQDSGKCRRHDHARRRITVKPDNDL